MSYVGVLEFGRENSLIFSTSDNQSNRWRKSPDLCHVILVTAPVRDQR